MTANYSHGADSVRARLIHVSSVEVDGAELGRESFWSGRRFEITAHLTDVESHIATSSHRRIPYHRLKLFGTVF
jgi:hypothetical protein